MCDMSHDSRKGFGFIVDNPGVRTLVETTHRLMHEIDNAAARVEALKPAFAELLAANDWLPTDFSRPDDRSRMGGGIGQYALYRAADGSLCLFSLVVPPGATTPVHDHLAWGLVGLYRGQQAEVVYRRLDEGEVEDRATLEVSRSHTISRGEFYALLPPEGDIHRVTTVSDAPSISIHLLANDTACIWRHKFDPEAGTVARFRSGYSNAPCPPDDKMEER